MKKTVAVFFGGVSPEHDISVITALSAVIHPLELSGKYRVVPVYITKSGVWHSDEAFKSVETFRTGKAKDICEKSKPLAVVFDGGFVLTKIGLRAEKIRIDIAFPAMHGGNGEDGSLMGIFRMANIPFVGSDMSASVVAMDKVLAKQVAIAANIPVTKYRDITGTSIISSVDTVVKSVEADLTYPLFVKPAHLGSSIGISRVTSSSELRDGLEVAAHYDNKIIVEEAVQNLIEVTVPIIGNQELTTGLLERPLVDAESVFDFDTKYMHGNKKTGAKKNTAGAQGYSELPAKLPQSLHQKALKIAKDVYRAAGCAGISRIDLLIDSKADVVYFNEINPMPGSLYAHNWRAAGISSVELVEYLVQFAEQRHNEQQRLETTFSTDFLQQF